MAPGRMLEAVETAEPHSIEERLGAMWGKEQVISVTGSQEAGEVSKGRAKSF